MVASNRCKRARTAIQHGAWRAGIGLSQCEWAPPEPGDGEQIQYQKLISLIDNWPCRPPLTASVATSTNGSGTVFSNRDRLHRRLRPVAQPPQIPQPHSTRRKPIVPAPQKSLLVPILIALVVLLGTALVGGLFTIVYLINRPPMRTVIVPPVAPPVHTSLIKPPPSTGVDQSERSADSKQSAVSSRRRQHCRRLNHPTISRNRSRPPPPP